MPSLPSSVFQKFIFKSEQDSTRLLPSYALVKLRPSAHAGTAATEASVTVRIQLKGRAYTSGLRSLQSAWHGRDLSPPGPTCLLGQASRPEGWEFSWPHRARCSRPSRSTISRVGATGWHHSVAGRVPLPPAPEQGGGRPRPGCGFLRDAVLCRCLRAAGAASGRPAAPITEATRGSDE